ncbi:MAG TPA: DUF998 domain-containing protein [Pseudonocardiaceae bacterium]|jgi:hypothetical membrane protein
MDTTQAARTGGSYPVGEGALARPARWLSQLAGAGIVGPVLFTVAFLAQEAFRRGEYDPLAEPVSALEAGPNGWIQQLNFVVFGLLTIAFAVGLHRGLQSARAGVAGPALLAISGVGLLLAAIFPLREEAGGVTYDPGGHLVAGFMFFTTSAVGLIVVSRRVAHDPRWRGLATYTLAAGLVALAGFLAGGALVLPDDAPLHDWAGLYQRVLVLAVVFPCRVVLSLRLLQVATGHR